jgi:DUF4097 and DUF4098 domain-containing protein YvlB
MRRVAVVIVALCVVCVAVGCRPRIGPIGFGGKRVEEVNRKDFPFVDGRDVRVDTVSGDVRVTRSQGREVVVTEKKTAHAGTEARARELLGLVRSEIEVRDGVLRVHTIYPKVPMVNEGVGIDYEIQSPMDVHLDAQSVSGDIEVDGVGKNAAVKTVSGDITVKGADGAFIVRNISGNIDIVDVAGDVDADTKSGNVKYHAEKSRAARLWLATVSGDVDARFPAGFSADVDAATLSGEIDNRIPGAPAVKGNRVEFKMGSGEADVNLRSLSGNVRLSQ